MTTPRRLAAILILPLILVTTASTAWAGPSGRQPAQVKLSLGEARYYARVGAGYLSGALERPEKPRLGECSKLRGRLLWTCPASIEGVGTRCTVDVWVWASRGADRYYEYHRLRCSDR